MVLGCEHHLTEWVMIQPHHEIHMAPSEYPDDTQQTHYPAASPCSGEPSLGSVLLGVYPDHHYDTRRACHSGGCQYCQEYYY